LTASGSRPKPDMNVVISDVLKYGVLASAILIGLGVVILFLNTPQSFPSTTSALLAMNYGKPTLDLSQLLSGVAGANPVYVIELGLIVLLATPVARVAASVLMYAMEKDKMYVAITLFVLIVLLFGLFVVGPIEAAA
jgi:uncharacterized membrane protein